jgi:hypothetical protein
MRFMFVKGVSYIIVIITKNLFSFSVSSCNLSITISYGSSNSFCAMLCCLSKTFLSLDR